MRRLARGRECQIRIPHVCTGDNDTVVLCHLGGGGMGTKRDDVLAAYGCSACHDVVDGRTHTDYPRELLKLWMHEAVVRTQQILLDEGVLVVKSGY